MVTLYSSGNESNPLFLCYFNRMLLFISSFIFLLMCLISQAVNKTAPSLETLSFHPGQKGTHENLSGCTVR